MDHAAHKQLLCRQPQLGRGHPAGTCCQRGTETTHIPAQKDAAIREEEVRRDGFIDLGITIYRQAISACKKESKKEKSS